MIRKGLGSIEGIGQIQPNFLNRTLRVQHDTTQIASATIVGELEQIGFSTALVGPSTTDTLTERDTVWFRRQPDLLLSILLATTAIGGAWSGWNSRLWAPLAASAAVLAGWPVVRQAWRAVRLRHLDMHVLMTLAMTGALLTGEWLEAAAGTVLFRISLLIDESSKRRAHRAIHSLVQLNPTIAHRLSLEGQDSADSEDIPVDQLQVGDHVLIRPGERIPADGLVCAGRSSVNQAPITGESIPVEKEHGGFVYGGSLNGEGALQVQVTHTADQSTPARIARLIEQAQATPSRTERVVDQFARRYTPAVIGLAVTLAVLPPLLGWWDPTLVGWETGGGWAFWKQWLFRSLVLLIIACPCALVISTPITILCGLHRASRLGILIKGGEFLESAGRVRCIALDKTGTVTEGKPKVVAVQPRSGRSEAEVLTVAAALEQHSEHPLAHAIVAEARRRDLTWMVVEDLQTARGLGVQATFEGEPCAVGSLRFVQQQGWMGDSDWPAEQASEDHASIVAVARAGDVMGFILLRDLPRGNARSVIQQWRTLCVQQIVMLTGDHEMAARQIADELGFDAWYANLLPEDKMEQIRRLAKREPALAMIGDGVNDAPARGCCANRRGSGVGGQRCGPGIRRHRDPLAAPPACYGSAFAERPDETCSLSEHYPGDWHQTRCPVAGRRGTGHDVDCRRFRRGGQSAGDFQRHAAVEVHPRIRYQERGISASITNRNCRATRMNLESPVPRSPLLLSSDASVLLVVDAQTRLLAALPQQATLVWNLERLVAAAELLDIPRLASEQYPKGLGPTVATLAPRLPAIPDKLSFSVAGCETLMQHLEQLAPRQILLAGAETHVCVLQSALDLLTAGYEVFLAVDATAARSSLDHDTALQRMQISGVTLTTTESALFEWSQIAGTETFRAISQLVKQSPPESTERGVADRRN